MTRASIKLSLGIAVCASLAFGGCADQLEGGIVDDDGEFGLGVPHEKESSKSSKSDKDESQDDPSSKKDSADEKASENDEPSPKDSSEPEGEESSSTGESEETTKSEGSTDTDEPSEDTTEESPKEEEEKVDGELKVSFTTESYGGRYGPRNVGAVWIEDKDGKFLRTLKKWAAVRTRHLIAWKKASGSDLTDAVTGATQRRHSSHRVTWDRKDASGKLHGVGDYLLRFELTEENSSGRDKPGPTFKVPFHLGGGSKKLKPDDAKGFRSIEIVTPD